MPSNVSYFKEREIAWSFNHELKFEYEVHDH